MNSRLYLETKGRHFFSWGFTCCLCIKYNSHENRNFCSIRLSLWNY